MPAGPGRLAGLDIFRGAAVAGMITVNNPGSPDHIWWPLDHAAWHGFTPTDLVFPAFLFAVGVALGLSFPRTMTPEDRAARWWRVIRRSLALIGLGLGFALLSRPDLAGLRFPGVLQRIGVCYGLAATFAILTARRRSDGSYALNVPAVSVAAFSALALYSALLWWVPVPGFGAGRLTPAGNLGAYVDRVILTTAHMWRGGVDASGSIVYDPEGLLSTLPALANVLFGMLAAAIWRGAPDSGAWRIAGAGVVLTLAGLALAPVMPINKRLWTSSFALLTSGLSAMLLALCLIAGTREVARRLLAPFTVLGMNAILGYCLATLVTIFGRNTILPSGTGTNVSLPEWGFTQINRVIADPYGASAAYGILLLAVVLVALIPFHRRGIFLRL